MEADGDNRATVVKVGGSLFDLPDLAPRLERWLGALPCRHILLVAGGGPLAEAVRDLDRIHALGEERAHWLALTALSLTARFVAALLPKTAVVNTLSACPQHWRNGKIPVLDPYPFARADDGRPGSLPHTWAVTSDSVAARAAVVLAAGQLVLLKSVALPEGLDWIEAGRRGFVDPVLAEVVGRFPVQWINLRESDS
jgi:aspartokinase-like uncharacterized kinase